MTLPTHSHLRALHTVACTLRAFSSTLHTSHPLPPTQPGGHPARGCWGARGYLSSHRSGPCREGKGQRVGVLRRAEHALTTGGSWLAWTGTGARGSSRVLPAVFLAPIGLSGGCCGKIPPE